MLRALADEEDEPPWLPPSGSGSWEWGEIYVWGGVTFTPGVSPKVIQEEEERLEREFAEVVQQARVPAAVAVGAGGGAEEVSTEGVTVLRQRVLRAVSEQYPVAWRGGYFAGKPVSPSSTTVRFTRLVKVLGISGEDAADLVEIDSTPLLVEPDGVASAFEQLSKVSSRDKALELVRCHPGLLVGGVRSLKEGAGLVTATLVDLLFAGRLLKVLEDTSRDNMGKLAEIELYAKVASLFKPVMDLVQRRARALQPLQMITVALITPVVAIACIHTLRHMGVVPAFWDKDLMACEMSLVMWLMWFASGAVELGPWALSLGSWFLGLGASLLNFGCWLVKNWHMGDEAASKALSSLSLGSYLFSVVAWAMGDASSTESLSQ